MTIDERIEFLLKMQKNREAMRNLRAEEHERFIGWAEEALQSMARTQQRLTDLEGGAQ
jgi:hypothetical protein